MAILQSILPVLVILLRILLSWFRNSNREENQIEEWELQRPPENRPKSKVKTKKGNPFKDRKPDPPVPPVPSIPLNEVFSRNFTDEEISAVREECGGDDDEAFKRLNARLDSQDQFQEVKPKRGRRNQLEALGSNASSSNTDAVTVDGGSSVEPAPAQESLNVDAENTRENPLVAPSVTSQELEAQGSNASGSNIDEVTIDAGIDVEPAPAQESLNVDAENTRENPSVAPSVTSSPSLSNAMNEQPSYNRKIAGAGSLISPSPALSHQIRPTTIGASRPLGSKNFAGVVRFSGRQATISHMVGETSPTSPLSEVFRESQEVQVSERNVTRENSSSNLAESNGSFTGEGDTCKVEGASQSNDGSVEDMASHNLPVEENECREVGARSSNNDIPATALSSDQLTLGQEDKEVSSISDDGSTTVLPERVRAQDADFSHLSSGAINSDVNTAVPSNESDPVKNNLNDGSANLNGSSGNNSTNREYQPLYWGQQQQQQRFPDIQRRNLLQLVIPDDRYNRQIPGWPFLPVQSDLSGSRYQNVQGQHPLVSRSNHFPQASSTALLPTNPGNFPPSSSNQSLQGHGQGRAGRFCRDAARAAIIAPLRNSPGLIQRPSQSDAVFRPRDAGSSTESDSGYQLFQRLSQPLLSGSIRPSTSLFSCIPDDLPPGSSYQNIQGQDEQLSEGDDAFPPLPSFLPPDLLDSSSDRTQGSSEEHEQP